jgi:hypothetical protein
VRRPVFELAPAGLPHTAIFWKNLISVGRLSLARILLPLISVGVGFAFVLFKGGSATGVAPMLIGSFAMAIAGFLTLAGPMMVRDDLRSDLQQADLLKTYPVTGWSLVLGEILAPTVILSAAEWFLLLVAALFVPGVGKMPLSTAQKLEFGLSAALLLPCFSLVGILIQNAAVLLWPGWVELGKAHRQGVEAMGQRLITMAGTMLALVVAVIPPGILFVATFFLGSWLIGLAILPIAAFAAALALLAEAAVAVLWLGRIYDRFDPSRA